ncbi:CAAX prenyl protease 2 [Blattella germanica]|nr:CAAX prenyl protease 2 [Blattella germanica]
MEAHRLKEYSCLTSAGACFVLSVVYVASLYIWNSPYFRDHPSTIKKRFLSVFIMMFISPLFLYYFSQEHILQKATIWQLLGLRLHGLLPAIFIPMFLTMTLFLGPLTMQGYSGLWKLYAEPMYWLTNITNLIWLRNHVVAPLSEEFTFRACMLPLLLQCFRPMTAIFVCPLFFGVAHFHHMLERMRNGLDFKRALMISCHFIAPFAAHAFCNHMGFPDFAEILTYKEPQRSMLMSLFVTGLVAWCLLLTPLTNPAWYDNHLFWKGH